MKSWSLFGVQASRKGGLVFGFYAAYLVYPARNRSAFFGPGANEVRQPVQCPG